MTQVTPGGFTVRLRLTDRAVVAGEPDPRAGAEAFDEIVEQRRVEADEFYDRTVAPSVGEPERPVVRQALAGMLWCKQWLHMVSRDIISMPDSWENPGFAAWDLAFHAVALALVDLEFAKGQLSLLLSRRYLHPNGQIPAYEWNFSDVNRRCTPGPRTWSTNWRRAGPAAVTRPGWRTSSRS